MIRVILGLKINLGVNFKTNDTTNVVNQTMQPVVILSEFTSHSFWGSLKAQSTVAPEAMTSGRQASASARTKRCISSSTRLPGRDEAAR